MARKFLVRTFGCQMNEHDSERIAADLVADGLERTEVLDEADVVVLNTCCIRENADNKLYGNLERLRHLALDKPQLQIAVGGCLAQKDREAILERAPHVDAVFGTHNVARAPALLAEARRSGRPVVEILEAPASDEDAFASALAVRPDLPHAAWVTIQVGCDNSCAFCIVPQVRGPEQSRPFGELVEEIAALARSGTSEVTLLGQNVNSYGRDLTLAHRHEADPDLVARRCGEAYAAGEQRVRPLFADLLRAVGAIGGIRRVRFTSPHPKDLRTETIAAMAETAAVCPQLHLPLQSGSDTVLAAMRRGYTAERYLARLAAARRALPGLAVSTDVIVGFPGEREADFEDTLAVVAEASYDSAYTFIYSPRPGTRAALLTEQMLPEEVIAERFGRLKAVVDRACLAAHERRVGEIEEIVVEGRSKRDATIWSGRTAHGKLLHLAPAPEELVPGRYGRARVTGAGPHHLLGELVSLEAAPARRRIALPLHAR
ncbi:MAG TPA: MiaB/RimO family radical SAM methylthiotransferase [Acidimicrobiales bacterium]|nr:MiaB/RimO family radical SAM methylthiotransferase [Acidimicrobiales bacterium]